MSHNNYSSKEIKTEIRLIATQILQSQIDFIEGCCKITSLANSVKSLDSDLFVTLRGIASESDRFPLGKIKDTCSSKHLYELEAEKLDFIEFYRQNILESCREIIKKL